MHYWMRKRIQLRDLGEQKGEENRGQAGVVVERNRSKKSEDHFKMQFVRAVSLTLEI